jgi:hypothetical protein
MNPPFGMIAENAKEYVEGKFPNSKGDILAHFVERALLLCDSNGLVGAISSRSCFFLSRLTAFRQNVLRNTGRLVCMADFGDGVLDATVETAAYVLSKQTGSHSFSVFLRILLSVSKATDLLHSIQRLPIGETDSNTFLTHTHAFDEIHNSPYAYWVPHKTISLLNKFDPIEGSIASVRVGLQTGEDARFLRMIWEVPANSIGAMLTDQTLSRGQFTSALRSTFRNGKRWAFYSKTDYASPWLSPIMLVVDWQDDGDMLKEHIRGRGYSPSKWVQSEDKYFSPGFSYMLRSTRLVPYIVPPGVIPTAGRSQVYAEAGQEIKALGICASRIGSAIARFSGESFARPKYQASMVQNIPNLPLSKDTEGLLLDVFTRTIDKSRDVFSMFEPWQDFRLPAYLAGSSCQNISWQLESLVGPDIEVKIATDVGLTLGDSAALCRDLDEAILIRTQKGDGATQGENSPEEDEYEDDGDSSQSVLDFSERAVAEGYVSYLYGLVFGRWDIRFALDKSLLPKPQQVLDPLPVVPPSTLVGIDGLPAKAGGIVSEEWLRVRPDASHISVAKSAESETITDKVYPIPIHWDGVISDDVGSESDIIRLIRSADEIIPKGQDNNNTEDHLCRQLGVKSLRDYLRKSGKGGFWDDHVNRYKAKRGRKAPIYWLLQSSKKNYAIWLYYHRLDKDLLFKALVNYVEPKIRLETSRLDSLRSQTAAAGENGKDAKRLAKDLEKQEDFLSELRDFEDKLRRAANLHLEPDLNDGVVLNIAPLRELVPWKEAKKYWDELMQGQYEWSSIGKQLREKGLVK